MGTLQTELANLKFDDDDDPTPENIVVTPEPESKTQARIIWDWLVDHPSSTAREVAEGTGIAFASGHRVLSVLFAKGNLSRAQHNGLYAYTTVGTAYPVITREEALQRAWAARRAAGAKKKHKASRIAKAPSAKVVPIKPEAPKASGVESILNSLNVVQARELLNRLKQLFGEPQ